MMNFGALNWFDSSIKKLKKVLDYTNHVSYTCVIVKLSAHLYFVMTLLAGTRTNLFCNSERRWMA